MHAYCIRKQKTIWCEKSVSSIDYADLLKLIFPDARFICLYRDCYDVINSSAEALKRFPDFGAQAFGWGPYLSAHRNNQADGFASYWLDKTNRIEHFRQQNVSKSFAIKYEDIVLDTNNTLAGLFQFLDLDYPSDIIDRIFSTPHDQGPGDGKIRDTADISSSSIGKGAHIANSRISGSLLPKIRLLMGNLGYPLT